MESSITVTAGYRYFEDKEALEKLVVYCERMGLSLEAMSTDGRVHIRITGSEQNLDELYRYLQDRKGDNQ